MSRDVIDQTAISPNIKNFSERGLRERPILFSGTMVRALLDGSKTQTRRVVTKGTSEVGTSLSWSDLDWSRVHADRGYDAWHFLKVGGPDDTYHRIRCGLGQPGDRLWVRETFALTKRDGTFCDSLIRGGARGIVGQQDSGRQVEYAADERLQPEPRWLPSIHMPRWASRISLEITAIRVERVQDISGDDAEAEGWGGFLNSTVPGDDPLCAGNGPRTWYHKLWESLNADRGYGWDANPWVWVVEFRRAA